VSATDYVLFPLSFLVSVALAGWIRQVSRERDDLSGGPSGRARDRELARITESLTSAIGRVEALERRYRERMRELAEQEQEQEQARALAPAAPVSLPEPSAVPEDQRSPVPEPSAVPEDQGSPVSEPAVLTAAVLTATEVPDPEAAAPQLPAAPALESEVSDSQWRSAMDRLGPLWRSGAGLTDPERRTPAVGAVGPADRPDPHPTPGAGDPLDDLFPPSAVTARIPRLADPGRDRLGDPDVPRVPDTAP
jgi:hypothetical protein